jgi:hypothetical protein
MLMMLIGAVAAAVVANSTVRIHPRYNYKQELYR